MIVMSSYNVVDAIFIGRGVGSPGLAAVAICFPLQLLAGAMAVMAGAGGASIISRSLGAGDLERARKAFGTTVSFASGIGILVSVFVLLFLEQVLRLFGATEAILPHAEAYLSVILFGIPLQMFAMVGNHAARAEGRARIAMTTLLISAILNMILDPVFIFGFGWGMRGAAVATVLSQMVMFLWIFGYFYRGKSALSFVREYLVPSPRLLREIVAVGSSEFVRMAAGSFSIVLINGALVHWGGDLHVAVYGVINRALSFFFMPLMGIAQGFQPILGYNSGAGNLDRARRGHPPRRDGLHGPRPHRLHGGTGLSAGDLPAVFRRPGPYRRRSPGHEPHFHGFFPHRIPDHGVGHVPGPGKSPSCLSSLPLAAGAPAHSPRAYPSGLPGDQGGLDLLPPGGQRFLSADSLPVQEGAPEPGRFRARRGGLTRKGGQVPFQDVFFLLKLISEPARMTARSSSVRTPVSRVIFSKLPFPAA